MLAVFFDLKMMLGLGGLGVLSGFSFWPSVAVGALAYTVLSTALAGRSAGIDSAHALLP